MNKAINLQDVFLNQARKERIPITCILTNGFQFKGIVTASELNIRSNPSPDGERVGALKAGARVEILEKSGNWGRTKDGWVSIDYIKMAK